jgi:hypothetical protein
MINRPAGMPDAQWKKLFEAEEKAAMWLYRGNVASEKGNNELAERHYDRAQKWHDKANDLLGWGEA